MSDLPQTTCTETAAAASQDGRAMQEAWSTGWLWYGGAAIVFVVLLTGVILGHRWLQTGDASPVVRFVVNDEPLVLDSQGAERFVEDLEGRLSEQLPQLQADLQPWQDARLAAMEDNFEAAAESYLDWYFSMPGSGYRLMVMLTQTAGRWGLGAFSWGAELGGWEVDIEENLEALNAMDDQLLQEHFLEAVGLDEDFAEIMETQTEQIRRFQDHLLSQTLTDIHSEYHDLQAQGDDAELAALPTIDLDNLARSAFQAQWDQDRWTRSGVGGIGIGMTTMSAGYALRPAISRSLQAMATRISGGPAVAGARQGLAGLVRRIPLRAARHIPRVAGQMLAGAPAGPAGAAIGAGASVVAILGIEYVQIRALEAEHRPAMEAEMRAAWQDLEVEMRHFLNVEVEARTTGLLETFSHYATVQGDTDDIPSEYRILDNRRREG